MKEEFKIPIDIEGKASAYHYIGTKDRHAVRLFHWIDELEKFRDEVRETEMDIELEKEIEKIVDRLTKEVGFRMVALFP